MVTHKILENIYSVGACDWDRRLFDELIPLPNGTTYNAYLITGSEKTALIDAVDPTKANVLLENLRHLKVVKIDYVIANHAEQDHSGAIVDVLRVYPDAKVVTNPKCKEMLKDLLHIPEEKFLVINDNDTLPLGDKTLQFIIAPWVHWPETMFTYLVEDRILFTCDFLGSHLASSELYAMDKPLVYESAKRYFAEIMMPFRTNIRKHLEKIGGLAVDIIAPSHGPIYNDTKWILDAYRDWVSDNVKNEVLIPYISMHGSTKVAVEYLTDKLIEAGITVKPFNLTETDLGALAIALVDAATIVIATPTVLAGPHPKVAYAALLVGALRPKTKFVGIVTSFGWASKVTEQLSALIAHLKPEVLGIVSVKGLPRESDLKNLGEFAGTIVKKHKGAGLM